LPTASNFYLLVDGEGKPKPPTNKERRTYLYRCVAERVLNELMPERFEGNDATDWGIRMEEPAANAFMLRVKADYFEPGGFWTSDNGRYGCSPDRMFNNRKEAVEIKCPQPWTHIRYMAEGPHEKTPGTERYTQQVQGQIMICGFDCVHFWSWHPPPLRPVHLEILPDERFQARLRQELENFCDEIEAKTDWVRRQGNLAEVIAEAEQQ
jgi:hypothetical protein